MGNKILKFNSIFLIIICSICIIIPAIYAVYAIISVILSSESIGLNLAIIIVALRFIYVLTVPTMISSINSLKYLNGDNTYKTYKTSINYSVISLLLFCYYLVFYVYIDF